MPLVKRTVEPVNIARGHVASDVLNELECVTNSTLANIICQLSSLSKHVEDMFGELHHETCSIFHRTYQLSERVERLKVKITQLNPTVEEVLLQDINMRKPFKSSVIKDQQVVTLATRPFAIKEIYLRCEPPPALQKLNPYRQDGKDSLKFYTEPGYFFELWCQAMQKESKNQMKRHRRTKRPAASTEKWMTEEQAMESRLSDGRLVYDENDSVNKSPQSVYSNKQSPAPSLPRVVDDECSRRNSRTKDRCESGISTNSPAIKSEQLVRQIVDVNGEAECNHTASPIRSTKEIREEKNRQRPNSLELQVGVSSDSVDVPVEEPGTAEVLKTDRANEIMNDIIDGGDVKLVDDEVPTSKPMENHIIEKTMPLKQPENNLIKEAAKLDEILQNLPIKIDKTDKPKVSSSSDSSCVLSDVVSSKPDLPPPPPTPPELAAKNVDLNSTSPKHSPDAKINTQPSDGLAEDACLAGAVTKSSTPDSVDLPPPPSPPILFSSNTPDSPSESSHLPLPPPPFEESDRTSESAMPLLKDDKPGTNCHPVSNGSVSHLVQSADPVADAVSITSDASLITVSSGSTGKADDNSTSTAEQPMIRDTRCDLLAAIREGIQLRKVEEHRQKSERKYRPTGRLDVQTIMEAAFEMRRKVLEENDSEEDEEDDELDGNWSDGD